MDISHLQTEIMRNEFERLAARQPLELLSMKRYFCLTSLRSCIVLLGTDMRCTHCLSACFPTNYGINLHFPILGLLQGVLQ